MDLKSRIISRFYYSPTRLPVARARVLRRLFARAMTVISMAMLFQMAWLPSFFYHGTVCGFAEYVVSTVYTEVVRDKNMLFQCDSVFAASIQSRYDKAKADLEALQSDAKRASYRDQWNHIERTFTQLLRDAKAQKWNNTAAIAYRVGVVRDELARRSFLQADYKRAAESYEDMARDYPRSVLADDAMLSAALLRANKLGDLVGCKAILRNMVQLYPHGDMAPTARVILNGADEAIFPPHRWVDGKSPLFGGASGPAETSIQKPSPAPKPQITVPPVHAPQKQPALPASKLRHLSWHNGPTTGTVLLDLDREARWRHQFVAGDAARNIPPRLYIDVDNCRMGGSSVSRGGHVGGSILSAVRVDTKTPQHIRVIIDFNAIHSYDVQVEHRNGYALRIIARNAQGASLATPNAVTVPAQGSSKQPQKKSSNTNQAPKIVQTAPPKDLVEQLGLGIHTIMIDAGHGGKDPGAMGHGLRESYIVLDMAKRLGKALKAQGFNVIYTRTSDVFIDLTKRTKVANDKKADLFISVHVNASTKSSTHGIETYYYASQGYSNSAAKVAARENGVREGQLTETQLILTDLALENKTHESEGLAKKVQSSMLGRLKRAGYKVQDNGVRSAPFYVLMGARMPAILVEIGYCSNKVEAKRLASPKYRDFVTQGIVQGILAYKKSLAHP